MADIVVNNYVDTLVGFKPAAAFPLDIRTMFGSLASAQAAAQSAKPIGSTESIYYIGMELTVIENGSITKYTIQADNTLRKSGSSLVGDSKSIEIKDTTVQIKDFGSKYFKYTSPDEILPDEYSSTDQLPVSTKVVYAKVNGSWFINTPGTGWDAATTEPITEGYYTETEGWTTGLEPKVAKNGDGEFYLAWYEPSRTTVEGLSSIVDSLQTATATNTTEIANLKTSVTEEINRATAAEDALGTRLTTLEGKSYISSVTASETNGNIVVDENEVSVYTLPTAGAGVAGALGGVKVDGTTIAVSEDGTISVAKVDVTKVEGLETKLEEINTNIDNSVTNQVTEVAVAKDNISTSTTMANNVTNASDEKVISEKAFITSMVWKEGM